MCKFSISAFKNDPFGSWGIEDQSHRFIIPELKILTL